ncbi:MAG: hypothetical protein A2Z68_00350 [Candidatus Nealsonbacteria bacterium RBG_13_38_11]|uniref:MobA-like NTP transferase domain-containing protein n=1 Tax=Candidatus Nealsonbacteria bacterium RBG_13_38_11 TaxID=1801662 RepID=A0A1G2DXN1_9BACT|nr:MAG: hypothetical protein A2Z68_00350 [Candidatus Nealsonbacteria bacterium RBG_13_38_11]
MKAIILAAGMGSRLRPLTNDKPKCLLEINGRTILDRQLEALREYSVKDISIIRGYKAEMLNFSGIKYYENTNYLNNNILNSLFYAEKEMDGEFIVSYSDIIYNRVVVEELLKSDKDIALVVDEEWRGYYQGRTEHPIEEAENVIIQNGKIVQIGKHVTANEAHGEFIGLAKFGKMGGEIFKKEFQRVKKEYWGKPFQKAQTFERAYLTDMFQELIDRGVELYSVKIKKNWWEIDTNQDLRKVRALLS